MHFSFLNQWFPLASLSIVITNHSLYMSLSHSSPILTLILISEMIYVNRENWVEHIVIVIDDHDLNATWGQFKHFECNFLIIKNLSLNFRINKCFFRFGPHIWSKFPLHLGLLLTSVCSNQSESPLSGLEEIEIHLIRLFFLFLFYSSFKNWGNTFLLSKLLFVFFIEFPKFVVAFNKYVTHFA